MRFEIYKESSDDGESRVLEVKIFRLVFRAGWIYDKA